MTLADRELAPSPQETKPPDFTRRVYGLLGIPLDQVTIDETTARIEQSIFSRQRLVWSTPNMNNLAAAQIDAQFRDVLAASDLCTADGMPIVGLCWLLGIPVRERVAGSSTFDRMLYRPYERQISVFFFGGAEGVAELACTRLDQLSCSMRSAGHYYPGFGSIESMSEEPVIERINAAKPDLLILSLGTARGHEWIRRNAARLDVPVIAHLGSVVNFMAGVVQRAPPLLGRLGLEWAWRILQEPHLARRYYSDFCALVALLAKKVLPTMAQRALQLSGAEQEPSLSITSKDGTHLIELTGSWNDGHLNPLRVSLEQATRVPADLVIDLGRVTSFGAGFIGLLLIARTHQLNVGLQFRLQRCPSRIARMFRINGSAHLLSEAVGTDSPDTRKNTSAHA